MVGVPSDDSVTNSSDEPDRVFGGRIVEFEVTDSTNLRALDAFQSHEGEDGVVFVADRQTAGRGSGGRDWESSRAEGLWFSLLLTRSPAVTPLSFLPAIAIVDVLTREYELEAHLKWPNDVLVGTRKLAGILVETRQVRDRGTGWVIGVGINLHQERFEPPLDEIGVSLKMAGVVEPNRDLLLNSVLREMTAIHARSGSLVDAWIARSRMIGRWIDARRGGERLRRRVLGLSPEGFLLVEAEDGRRDKWISHGEIEIDRRY